MADLAQKSRQAKAAKSAALKPKASRKQLGRKPGYVQTKMAMSTPGDAQEQEADQVAEKVSRSPRGVQRKATEQAQRASAAPQAEQGEQSLAPVRRKEEPAAQPKLRRQAKEEAQPKLQRMEEPQAQAKLQRAEEEEAVQGKLCRAEEEEAQTKLQRFEEEEEAQTKLHRAEEETAQTKLQRSEEESLQTMLARAEEEAQTKLQRMQGGPQMPQQGLNLPNGGQMNQAVPDEEAEGEVPASVEQRIEEQRGNGSPLPDDIRAEMEEKIGADFSSVSIHTDGTADELCKELNARAFAVGNDVFFAAGEYAPDTEAGRKLLAHELTHVAQQSNGAQRAVMREENESSDSASGYGEKKTGFIEFPSLEVPAETVEAFRGFNPIIRHKTYSRKRDDQTQVWRDKIKTADTVAKLRDIAQNKLGADNAPPQYYFEVPTQFQGPKYNKPKDGNTQFLIGSLEECAKQASIPKWDKQGKPHASSGGSYDVDHIVEQQFGASKATGDFALREGIHDMSNFWLLDAKINRGAKTDNLKKAFIDAVTRFRNDHKTESYGGKTYEEWDSDALRRKLSLVFNTAHAGSAINASGNNVWTQEEIESGSHIDALKPEAGNSAAIFYRTLEDIENAVPANKILIFYSPSGGAGKQIDPDKPKDYQDMLSPFRLSKRDSDGDTGALMSFTVSIPENNKAGLEPRDLEEPVNILPLHGSERVGTLPKSKFPLIMGFHALAKQGMSPITVQQWDVLPDVGMSISGQILPTLPLLDGGVDFKVEGDDLTLSKSFSVEEISVPAPFSISECTLTLSGGSKGLAAEGQVDFEIDKLGKGYVKGTVGTGDQLGAEGAFNFDSKTFDPAEVKVGYVDNKFFGEGTVGIPGSKIPGVKQATIKARFAQEEGFSASGEAELDIPGVEKGTLTISHSEEAGLAIGGTFNLTSDIPGIKSGTISAELKEKPDGEGYAVKASGEAVPDVPGFNSKLKVEYDDGAITMEAEAQYQKGMLDGSVKVGATNRTLDEGGNPTGEPGKDIIFYGGGELGLTVAPWLKATVGVNFLPNADIEVKGEIGLPDSIEIFPRKEIKKDIFGINIPIPIVPGIFAEVGGGLDASAGIGPGEIDELKLGIEYNPNDEANTHVYGSAHLNIPADAGLRLSVKGGIGLGIPAASVSGGLEVGGQLGIAGAAEAGVQLDWTPSSGLEMNAYGKLSAQPRFKFDVSGYVEVEALFFTIYENRWELASFEFGSDMTFGVKFPVHYKEGEPFEISLSDVEFEVPDINPTQLLSDLVDRVA